MDKGLVDGEEEAPRENAHVRRPRGRKASKADLAREASAMAMADALKSILANSQVANAAMYEKKRLDKEATAAMYVNLTKEAIEVRRMEVEATCMNVESKRLEDEAKKLSEETRIMLADLSNINPEQREWILKR